MAPERQARRIALVGASGNLGTNTLKALLSQGIHKITVITRPESKSSFPSEVTVQKVSYDDQDLITETLKGNDVLAIQLGIMAMGFQENFLRAAAKAGIQWVLPTEWGSDPNADEFVKRFAFLPEKRERRRLIEQLGVSSWTAVVTNPWYDYCFTLGAWGIDVNHRKAVLWEGGNYKINTTTLKRAGEATAEVLALPDEQLAQYRNGVFRLTSFYVTQKEMLDSMMRVTGTTEADWDISVQSFEDAIRECEEREAAAGIEGDLSAFQKRFIVSHFQPGLGGDFNDKVEDLGRFGLEKEDLDEVSAAVVKALQWTS